jgi:small GTP-binding protein
VFDNFSTGMSFGARLVELSLWDTAGPEEYSRLRALSYPETDVFLLCFSVVSPTSFANIRAKWWPEVLHHMPEARLLLVGTKIDLREDAHTMQKLKAHNYSPISAEQGEQLAADIKGWYVECSALTQQGVKQVFDKGLELCVGNAPPKNSNKCVIC